MPRLSALGEIASALINQARRDGTRIMAAIRQFGPSQFQKWVLAALLGFVSGLAAYYFAETSARLLRFLFSLRLNQAVEGAGAGAGNLIEAIGQSPWWWVVFVPSLGGLLTGLILHAFTGDGRVQSISHVIEGAALKQGRVEEKSGAASVAASFLTLGMGGSTGQEGPIVHLGALIASKLSNWIRADGMNARDLLACAAAAGIGASFNAPIAGIIFAHEIILRHYSISSFTPITIASIVGTIAGHLLSGGNFVEIRLLELEVTRYSEIPAFILLGILSGFVAVLCVRAIFLAEDIGDLLERKLGIWRWARPMIGGALLGLIALSFPHILGTGYQTTISALSGEFALAHVIMLTLIKALALAITMGARMGGGIFSPSLMIGALSGLGFGLVAVDLGGDIGTAQLYALAGMAAVSAAVLGAPLSTSVIIFEMTNNWSAALVVLASVSVASGIAGRMLDKSFFLTQLERRGLHIAAGPQAYLQAMFKVRTHMKPLSLKKKKIAKLKEAGAVIGVGQSFEEAFLLFKKLDCTTLLVMGRTGSGEAQSEGEGARKAELDEEIISGQLDYIDALRLYSEALANTSAEEHD